MATIEKRVGKKRTTYKVTVRVTGYPTACATFDRRADAVEWAAEIEGDMRTGRYLDRRAVVLTLVDALALYIEQVSSAKAESTAEREAVSARALIIGLGGDTRLSDINQHAVQGYIKARKKQVSDYSVRLELALLSDLFREAQQTWLLPVDNPVAKVRRPPEPQGRIVFLTEVQAEAFINEAKKCRAEGFGSYVLTLLHTAMRPGEAAALRVKQVDVASRGIFLGKTKNGEKRIAPMTRTLCDELQPLTDGRDPEAYVFFPDTRNSLPLHPAEAFRSAFEHARERAGMPWLHKHDLRHTAASYMVMRGVDPRTLAAILGHKTLKMVMRYTHLLHEHNLKAIDRLEGFGTGAADPDDRG